MKLNISIIAVIGIALFATDVRSAELNYHDELRDIYHQERAITKASFEQTIRSSDGLDKKVTQLITRRQLGVKSCGHSVVGACVAAQVCLLNNRSITSDAITQGTLLYMQNENLLELETELPLLRTFAEQYDEAQGDDFANIIHRLSEANVPDAYCIKIEGDAIRCSGTSAFVQFDEYAQAVEKLNMIGESGMLYFPSLVGNADNGHWVLIMLLKYPYKAPQLLFVDSLNCSLGGWHGAAIAVNELHERTKNGRRAYKDFLKDMHAANIRHGINLRQQEQKDQQIASDERIAKFVENTGWNPNRWAGWILLQANKFGLYGAQ
jgi:hypothetical protein